MKDINQDVRYWLNIMTVPANKLYIYLSQGMHYYNHQNKVQTCMEDNPPQDHIKTPETNKSNQSIFHVLPSSPSSELISEFEAISKNMSSPETSFAKVALSLPRHYRLASTILEGYKINEFMRARLRTFIMIESSRQFLTRQTSALTCTLIDLYFLNRGVVCVQQFQSLCLGCLILALKITEGKFPTITYGVFSKQELLGWEKKIARKLNYHLSPPTYMTYAQKLVFMWDDYISRSQIFNTRISYQPHGYNPKIRRFYQQLDTLYLFLKTLDFPPELLVANLLYLHAKILNSSNALTFAPMTNQNFLQAFYPRTNDKFKQFFQIFLDDYSDGALKIDSNVGLYLKRVISIDFSTKAWPFNQQLPFMEKVRCWDIVQTCTVNRYNVAKEIMLANR